MLDQLQALFGDKDLTMLQEGARTILCFFYGLLMLRLSGRRTFAQLSAVDLVISVVVGSNLSRAMTGGAPFWGTLLSVAILVGLHLLLAYAVANSVRLSRWIEGSPVILALGGVLDHGARIRSKISLCDIDESLRGHGLDGLQEIGLSRKLVLEPSGRISVLKA